MENTINAIVNNFIDRIGDIGNTPLAEGVTELSHILVEETAREGSAYAIGSLIAIISVWMIFILLSRRFKLTAKDSGEQAIAITSFISAIVVTITGIAVGAHYVSSWIAPTKCSIHELLPLLV